MQRFARVIKAKDKQETVFFLYESYPKGHLFAKEKGNYTSSGKNRDKILHVSVVVATIKANKAVGLLENLVRLLFGCLLACQPGRQW